MSKVQKTSTTEINASANAVWETLANQFIDVSKWAGGVTSSIKNPETPNGVNGSKYGGRICEVKGAGTTDERITEYNDADKSLTYSVKATGLPSFVESLTNNWQIEPIDSNSCRVKVLITANTKGLMGSIGAVPMGMMLGKAAKGLPNDLKIYVESQQ